MTPYASVCGRKSTVHIHPRKELSNQLDAHVTVSQVNDRTVNHHPRHLTLSFKKHTAFCVHFHVNNRRFIFGAGTHNLDVDPWGKSNQSLDLSSKVCHVCGVVNRPSDLNGAMFSFQINPWQFRHIEPMCTKIPFTVPAAKKKNCRL